MAESTVFTLAEAAEVLGVHYETVARWVRRGKLRGVKLSRRKVVVPKENLDAFLRGIGPVPGSDQRTEAGHPHRWLTWAGTLTAPEAAALRSSALDFETIEAE